METKARFHLTTYERPARWTIKLKFPVSNDKFKLYSKLMWAMQDLCMVTGPFHGVVRKLPPKAWMDMFMKGTRSMATCVWVFRVRRHPCSRRCLRGLARASRRSQYKLAGQRIATTIVTTIRMHLDLLSASLFPTLLCTLHALCNRMETRGYASLKLDALKQGLSESQHKGKGRPFCCTTYIVKPQP